MFRNKMLYVCQKMFLKIWRELLKHSVVLGCLYIHYVRKELHHWEKTHASVITLLMANRMRNFDAPDLQGFLSLRQSYMHRRTTVKISFRQVRITNNMYQTKLTDLLDMAKIKHSDLKGWVDQNWCFLSIPFLGHPAHCWLSAGKKFRKERK